MLARLAAALEFDGVVVRAELCPKLAKVVEASKRRRLGEINDSPDDSVNHLWVPGVHGLVKAGEHLLGGVRALSEGPLEVEPQNLRGCVDAVDLNMLRRRNGGTLGLFLLPDPAVLTCVSDLVI